MNFVIQDNFHMIFLIPKTWAQDICSLFSGRVSNRGHVTSIEPRRFNDDHIYMSDGRTIRAGNRQMQRIKNGSVQSSEDEKRVIIVKGVSCPKMGNSSDY